MGYFSGKTNSTAEEVKNKLRNETLSNLQDEATKNNTNINTEVPRKTYSEGPGTTYSGDGVTQIEATVRGVSDDFNNNYRELSQKVCEERKKVFIEK